MASNKEKIISEIEDTMDLYKIGSDMRGAYKRLLESLEKVPEEDVAKWAIANQNAINFYLNDKENTSYRLANGKEPDWIPEPKDFMKMFNDPKILTRWKEIPDERLEFIAEENGMNVDDLKQQLEKESLIQSRKDQMRGTNTLQQIFTPRLYEKRLKEGVDTDILGKELALDILENGLYMLNPAGKLASIPKIAQMLGKGGKALNFVGSAAGNPAIMESLDAIAYDDDDESGRGQFNTGDVIAGTATNVGAPLSVKLGAAGIGRMFGGMGKPEKFSRYIWDFGNGGFADELAKIQKNNEIFGKLKKTVESEGLGALTKEERKFYEEWGKAYNPEKDKLREEILKSDGKTLEQKRSSYYEKKNGKPEEKAVKKANSDEFAKDIESSNYASLEGTKNDKQILGERMFMNWLVNKYGDVGYDSKKNSSLVGFGKLGELYEEYMKDIERENARKEALDRYKVNLMLGGE